MENILECVEIEVFSSLSLSLTFSIAMLIFYSGGFSYIFLGWNMLRMFTEFTTFSVIYKIHTDIRIYVICICYDK